MIDVNQCILTHTRLKIKQPWSDTETNYHTGVDIYAASVYSICKGVVIDIRTVDTHTCVIVQYDANQIIKYMNLASCRLRVGQLITANQYIGNVDRYVHLEYLTRTTSIHKEIVCGLILYKQDPTPVITSENWFDNGPVKEYPTREGDDVQSRL